MGEHNDGILKLIFLLCMVYWIIPCNIVHAGWFIWFKIITKEKYLWTDMSWYFIYSNYNETPEKKTG